MNTRTERVQGESVGVYTTIVAPYKNTSGFYCEIYKEGFFQSIGKKLGMQDIEVGIPEFDDCYILKSNQPETLRKILNEPLLVKEIKKHPNIKFMVKTKNRFLGDFHPAGIDQLFYEEEGYIVDIEKLESIFEVFTLFYELMLQLEVAD